MDYSYILNTSLPQKEKLLDFGFSEVDASLVLKKEIADGNVIIKAYLSSANIKVYSN